MFKTLAFLSALATVILAQNTTAASSLIPAGISDTCKSFLTEVDGDKSLATCFKLLNTATSAFAPSSTSTVSKPLVTQALASLCSDSVANSCPQSLISSWQSRFLSACASELTSSSKNAEVVRFYEVLWIVSPFRGAICSKDDSGDFCVFSSHGTTSSSDTSVASLISQLVTRAESAVVPNMQAYHDKNIAFLYFTPDLDATKLCTACARQVVTTYTNWESNVPFAPGLENGQIMSQQAPLFAAISDKCPAGFLNGAVQAAGGLSGSSLSGAVPSISMERSTIVAGALGAAAVLSFF